MECSISVTNRHSPIAIKDVNSIDTSNSQWIWCIRFWRFVFSLLLVVDRPSATILKCWNIKVMYFNLNENITPILCFSGRIYQNAHRLRKKTKKDPVYRVYEPPSKWIHGASQTIYFIILHILLKYNNVRPVNK